MESQREVEQPTTGSEKKGRVRPPEAYAPEDIIVIGIDTDDGPEHVLFDEESNAREPDETMIRNIRFNGVAVPVVLRKGADAEHPECVAGRQRIRAARLVNDQLRKEGLPEIKVRYVMRRGDDRDLDNVVVSENHIRRVVSPLASSRALQRYLDRGHSEEEAAIQFGVTGTTIKLWLAMGDLSPEVQAQVDAGVVSANAAMVVADLPKAEQAAVINEAVKASKKAGKKKASETVVKAASKKAKDTKAKKEKTAKAKKANGTDNGNGADKGEEHEPEAPLVTPPSRPTLKRMLANETADLKKDGISWLEGPVLNFLHWIVTGEGEAQIQGLPDALKGARD